MILDVIKMKNTHRVLDGSIEGLYNKMIDIVFWV